MLSQLCFFVSIAFSFITWGIVAARYIWPALRDRQPAEEALDGSWQPPSVARVK
jgi:hypothetical protein